MEAWWTDADTRSALLRFHETYARQPNLDQVRAIHTGITDRIRERLARDGQCKRLIYTGSAYEGVQIGPDIEFDVVIVMDGSDLEVIDLDTEHFYLKAREAFSWGAGNRYTRFIDPSEGRYLVPSKAADAFKGTLQTALNTLHIDYDIKLRSHGPAIQMDVSSRAPRQLLYSVDMVPCFQTSDGRQFVAKPIKGETALPNQHLLWRQSFSDEEMAFMRKMDFGNGCRKKIIRILKAIRQHDDSLQGFTSYHFKTAMMWLCERYPNVAHWGDSNLVARLMDTLGYLEQCLCERRLDHKYFGAKVNLFGRMSAGTLDTMYNRIRRIRTCKHIFMDVMRG